MFEGVWVLVIVILEVVWDNIEITLASSPEVNTYTLDRIKVAEYIMQYTSTSGNLLKQKK